MKSIVEVKEKTDLLGSENKTDKVIEEALSEACSMLAPSWDIRDFVAVNPFFNLRDKSYISAMKYVEASSRVSLFADKAYYQSEFDNGNLTLEDLKFALNQIKLKEGIFNNIDLYLDGAISFLRNDLKSPKEFINSLSDQYDEENASNFTETITHEISKWLAAYFDESQALWQMPFKEKRIFSAWRMLIKYDNKFDKQGFSFSKLIVTLPSDPIYAIEKMFALLEKHIILNQNEMVNYIYRLITSVQGWACYIQKFEFEAVRDNDQSALSQIGGLVDLIAIRMAYDLMLLDKITGIKEFKLNLTLSENYLNKSYYDYVWQLASEQAYRKKLLNQIRPRDFLKKVEKPKVQMAFCIDVRSEVMRRHIEHQLSEVQTIGFAGFFGVPISVQRLGQKRAEQNCPILLTPLTTVHETSPDDKQFIKKKLFSLEFERIKKDVKSAANSCFSFVEAFGWSYIFKMFSHAQGVSKPNIKVNQLGLRKEELKFVRYNTNAIDLETQYLIGKGALKNMGLNYFAPFIIFFGHHSESSNNPYAGGLDCGACAGHSGASNSQVLADILNNEQVRTLLWERDDIQILDETIFLAGVHNTTKDELIINDSIVPKDRIAEIEKIKNDLNLASKNCAKERLSKLGFKSKNNPKEITSELNQRANNWSEIRPEWGLAGNASFIIARRERTHKLSLWGRSFLHDYDSSKDDDLSILELIMTAPMVVTNWINMQYFASSVANEKFGTGNKVLHNVVGGIGCIQGNQSDLLNGLSEQSVKRHGEYIHEPLRLQVIIEASTDSISKLLNKHQMVNELVSNDWVNLISIDPNTDEMNLYESNGWMAL